MRQPLGTTDLPESLELRLEQDVAVITLTRPEKRNALNDDMVRGLGWFFSNLDPKLVRAVVLDADGDHFCAGLDLAELADRDVMAGMEHSQMWHRAFAAIESSCVPVVAVLKGAVVGGGLELATACHLRVAEHSTFYALPEGQRGLFVGGGASVRVPRLIGTARMTDMMLTGRTYDAADGMAVGLNQYIATDGNGFALAMDLARKMASNAPQTNFAVLQALPHIAAMSPNHGYFMESLVSAVAQGTDDAKGRMAKFLEGRAAKVR